VFYQYVRTAALNQQQTQYVVVFTAELFAHYLYVRCLSVMKHHQFTPMLSTDEVQRHTKYIVDHLSIADILLLKSMKMSSDHKCHYKPLSQQCQYSAELDKSELVEFLQQSAVEHLTTYRHFQAKQLGSVYTIVSTDFEALYVYKCGDFERCLQLSTQNVDTLLCGDGGPVYVWHARPELLQLMDDNIVSLNALTLIANPECDLL